MEILILYIISHRYLYSSILSNVFDFIISFLALTEKEILNLKNEKKDIKEKASKRETCIIFKLVLFYLLVFLLLIFFWFYISCFCFVYKNTQIYLIKDTITSFAFTLIYPFGLCLISGIFRIISLKAKNEDKECMYKISKLI